MQYDRVVSAFKPPFGIIYRIAMEARRATQGMKKQADGDPTACPTLLPRRDSNHRPGGSRRYPIYSLRHDLRLIDQVR